jgi:hypothetical protein
MPGTINYEESLILVLFPNEIGKIFLNLCLRRSSLFILAEYSFADTVIIYFLKNPSQSINLGHSQLQVSTEGVFEPRLVPSQGLHFPPSPSG